MAFTITPKSQDAKLTLDFAGKQVALGQAVYDDRTQNGRLSASGDKLR